MDFVQRNLINERNNLQIELAKAKLLIAELSENAHVGAANAALNDAEKHWNPKNKEYFREAEPHLKIARGALDAAKSAGVEGELMNKAQNNHDRIAARIESKPQNEQAQYISRLENAVIALAESMNVSPEELMELNSPRSFEKLGNIARAVGGAPQGGSPIQRMGNGVPQATNLEKRVGHMLGAAGVPGARGVGPGTISIRDSSTNFKHWKDVGSNTSIEFDHPSASQQERDYDASAVRRSSKAEMDKRVVAKEKASRTFESMNMSVEDLIEYNSPRNLQRLAGMARAANDGTLKPMGGGVQPAGHLKRRIAMMLGASGLRGANVDPEDRIVASQRQASGGYQTGVISDKTPIEFNNPDVKPGAKVDYDRSVRFNSVRAQLDRTDVLKQKAAAAERASRTY